MGTTIRGIYKGFKYTLSQIFVVKEREIEIGYPTDVKHVAHIGWDGPAGSAPSWMSQFKTGPDFATSSITALSLRSSSVEFGEPKQLQLQSGSDIHRSIPPTEVAPIKKKPKGKKCRPTSSPTKLRDEFLQGNAKANNIEVA